MFKRLILVAIVALLTSNVWADPNLIAHYTFDESSGSIVTDSSEYGNDGYIYDANRVTGKVGSGALEFDGIDDYVDIPVTALGMINNEVTLSIWMYGMAESVSGIRQYVVDGSDSGGGTILGQMIMPVDKIQFSASEYMNAVVDSNSQYYGQWNNWTFTKDRISGEMKMYVNGELFLSGSGKDNDMSGVTELRIGSRSQNRSFYTGKVDDVRVYNRAVSYKEILELSEINLAKEQSPDGQMGLPIEVDLSWAAAYSESRSFNVYYGTDSNNVAGSQPSLLLGDTVMVQVNNTNTMTETFTPDSTYYWRVDVVDGANVYPDENVHIFGTAVANSFDFIPADDTNNMPANNVTLSWSPGSLPVTGYNVYLGTSQSAVNSGSGTKISSLQESTVYETGSLQEQTTYYWKVEDVGATTVSSPVMSFTTAGEIDPNLIGWYKFDEAEGGQVIDYSGNGNPGTLYGATIVPDVEVGEVTTGVINFDGADDYVDFQTDAFSLLDDQITMAFWQFGEAGNDDGNHHYLISGTVGSTTTCYRVFMLTKNNTVQWVAGKQNSIAETPTVDQYQGQWNHWVMTKDADSGDMYVYCNGELFGTDGGDTLELDKTLDTFRLGAVAGDPASLFYHGSVDDFKIYNRVLTQNEAKDLYEERFPPDYIMIDDMESYDDSTKPIDGPGGWRDNDYNHDPGGDCYIGKAELGDPVYGNQSLKFGYNNQHLGHWAYYNSECVKIFDTPQNWSMDIKMLTINLHGNQYNSQEKLYVALEDNSGNFYTIYHQDPNILLADSWQVWNIPLADFTGVNLTQVKYLYLGCGQRFDGDWANNVETRSGFVYFDNIVLNPPSCLPDKAKPDGDLNDDCVVDLKDVQVMADFWLDRDIIISPEAVSDANLLAWWQFDETSGYTLTDSSGNGFHATMYDGTHTEGMQDGALYLDGVDDYIDVPNDVLASVNNEVSFAFWQFGDPCAIYPAHSTVLEGMAGTAKEYRIYLPLAGTNSNIQFRAGNESMSQYSPEPNEISGQWNHWAFTKNAATGEMKMYLNGMMVVSDTGYTNTMEPTTAIRIGASVYDPLLPDKFYQGSLDDFRIYSRVLSDGEVLTLAGAEQYIVPIDPLANILTQENPGYEAVDYKDFSVIADNWLIEVLWP